MNSHYASISKSARTTEKYVSAEAMKYRDILNVTHTDYNKFFFETLTEIDGDIQGLLELYKAEWEEKSSKAFDYSTNSFLEYLSGIGDVTDDQLVEALSKILTGFEIEFWSDSKVDDFTDILRTILTKLDDYEPSDELGEGDIKMTIEYGHQAPVISRFSEEELSTNGKMMLNKMKATIKSFGESLSYEEKLNVMSLIFKDIIG